MNYMNILFAVIVLGVLGVVFGVVLAIAAKIFAVEKDEREEQILALLPGANCGGCGYAGCGTFANALVNSDASPTLCGVADNANIEEIAKILGIEIKPNTKMVAVVCCKGGKNAKIKYDYVGAEDCYAAARLSDGYLECKYGCLGLGTCKKACAFGAISIEDGFAVIDSKKCTGCMKCLTACPRNIIIKVPYTADVTVACSSKEKGAVLRNICNIGCIGCNICVKTCQYGAISVTNNLAVIDHEKCQDCGECAKKCPRKIIIDSKLEERTKAEIKEESQILQPEQ